MRQHGGLTELIGGAGRGGAGLLTCLKTLAYTASAKGWRIAYSSNYNPETRGGLVEGTMVMTNEGEVLSPVLDCLTAVIVFDMEGYHAYGHRLAEGGLMVWDSSKIQNPPPLPHVRSYGIPIYRMAEQAGAGRLANMAMLGAYNRIRGYFSVDELIAGMEQYLPAWRRKLIPYNRMILEAVTAMDVEAFRVQ